MTKKVTISLLLGGLLSAVTLFLAFRNVPLAELTAYLKTVNYFWIVPTVGLVMATFVLRVFRWRLILKGAAEIGFREAYHPLMIGFMINCLLPGRLGEIARPVLLKQRSRVPVTTGLATVVAERIFDIAFLILLFTAVYPTITRHSAEGIVFAGMSLNQATLQSIVWGMARIGLVLLAGMGLFALQPVRDYARRVIQGLPHRRLFSHPRRRPLAEKASRVMLVLIDNFAAGLNLVKNPGRLLICLGLSGMIWGLTVVSYYSMARGCPGIDLGWIELTTVMVVVCIFIALPSAPGFWGLWEAGGVFALSLFGVAAKDAAGFTLVNHAVQMFPVIVAGLISAVLSSVNVLHLSVARSDGETVLPGDQEEAS
jgi:glycosyltransferase 2 family protein